MCAGRKIVTRVGSFPFLKGPTRFRKFSLISDSPKRHWISVPASFSFAVFGPTTKTNFERQTLHRVIPVTQLPPQILEYGNIRILEPFWVSSEHIMWPNRDLSLIWAEWFSSRDLFQTPLVRKLFKPVEFRSRFSSGFKAQSSSEGRIKLKSVLVERYLGECYVPNKWPSIKTVSLLVVSSFWWLSSWGIRSFPCFAFFDGVEMLESLDSCVKFPTVSFCSMMLSMRKILCKKLVATRLSSSEN